MKEIYSSATKVVLLMFSITLCAGFLIGKISDVVFITAAMTVIGAYFGDKSRPVDKGNGQIVG